MYKPDPALLLNLPVNKTDPIWYYCIIKGDERNPKEKEIVIMYNYRQHFISEETARTLEKAGGGAVFKKRKLSREKTLCGVGKKPCVGWLILYAWVD